MSIQFGSEVALRDLGQSEKGALEVPSFPGRARFVVETEACLDRDALLGVVARDDVLGASEHILSHPHDMFKIMERHQTTFADIQLGERTTSGSPCTPSGSTGNPTGSVEERITAGLDELEQRLGRGVMPPTDLGAAMQFLERIRARVDSLMCTAAQASAGTEANRSDVLRDKTRLSAREAKRSARVADRLSEMPRAAESFASGDISLDHAAALANAAEKVGADVVESDLTLLDEANRTNSDQFSRRARDWTNRKLIEQGVSPLEAQRRAREAKLWTEKETGLGVLLAKLPADRFEHVRQAVDTHYIRLLRRDGADGQNPEKVRTPKQRLADVVFELMSGRDAITGESIEDRPGVKAKASTQLIITAPLAVVDGTDPDRQCEMIGVGPVPPDILRTLTKDTELAGMIFDLAGRPLWLGRNQRLGNAAQRLAVAVRDGGCFECGAPMHRCELHHMREWHRDRGPTDVDNLIAVCRKHHRRLDSENLAVRRTANGRYRTYSRDGPTS